MEVVIDRILIVYIIYALLLTSDWLTHLVLAAPCFVGGWVFFQFVYTQGKPSTTSLLYVICTVLIISLSVLFWHYKSQTY